MHLQDILRSGWPTIHHEKWESLRLTAMAMEPPNGRVMPISNALSAVCGILWTASYLLLTVRAFKDRSYGMPIFALCLNITCEFIYGFIYPPDPFNTIIFAGWAITDVFLFVATARYGKHEWQHAPLVANNLIPIMAVTAAIALWLQLAFASELIPVIGRQIVWFGTGPVQIVLSLGGVMQLLSRHHTRGHSVHIWWTRAVGTLAANLCFLYRAMEWPERFGYAVGPVGMFYILGSSFIDVVYIITFLSVRRYEQGVFRAKKDH